MNDNLRLNTTTDPLVSLGYRVLIGFAKALCIWCYYGTFNVFRDVDHIPYYLSLLLPSVYGSFASIPARFTHRIGFNLIWVSCIGLGAYVIGRVTMIVVSQQKE